MINLEKDRYLLCRPEGGLNDILSEIGKSIAYGRRFNRVVIVQTNSQDHFHFNDEFGHYFTSRSDMVALEADKLKLNFNAMSVRPDFLSGQVNDYRRKKLHEVGHTQPLSFDFSKDYTEQLLVHHSSGQQKRRHALLALSNLTLTPNLAAELDRRLRHFGGPYCAFHIRHTDYKTNYAARVRALVPHIHGRIFLATDNKAVVSFFEDVFGKVRLTTFSKLPDVHGKPLHHFTDQENAKSRNTDAILDLLMLSLAEKYYFFPRESGDRKFFAPYSGFSSLAARLSLAPDVLRLVLPQEFHHLINKPTVLQKLRNWRWRYF